MLASSIRNGSLYETLITFLEQHCVSISQLKQIHGFLITSSSSYHVSFTPKVLSLLVNPSNANYIHRLLLHTPNVSLPCWNKLIRTYASSRTPNRSIKVFIDMLRCERYPDHFTYPFLVKASARGSSVEHGSAVHAHVVKTGHEVDAFIQNSLIHMYGSCGVVVHARKVFDEMTHRTSVSWNSMLDGYAKCGDLKMAHDVFESMPSKDVVSWSSLIDGYVKAGEYREALVVFEKMKRVGQPKANEVTMVSVLCACAHLGALERGQLMHHYIVENELPLTLVLLTSLVDMYAKCGAVNEAMTVFKSIPKNKTDVLLWNAIIGGLANHGHVKESLDLFGEMKTVGIVPDEITYLCLLSACAHGGLVSEAWRFFEALKKNGMTPKSEHYASMVDVLARAGEVEVAYDFLNQMPMDPTPSMLGALLSGCMKHRRLELAEEVGKRLIEVDPYHDGRYVGLANVYAAIKRWDDANIMRKAMEMTGVKKVPGYSYVEIFGFLEMFIAHDKTHPKSVEIYWMVDLILKVMKRVVPCDKEEDILYLDVF